MCLTGNRFTLFHHSTVTMCSVRASKCRWSEILGAEFFFFFTTKTTRANNLRLPVKQWKITLVFHRLSVCDKNNTKALKKTFYNNSFTHSGPSMTKITNNTVNILVNKMSRCFTRKCDRLNVMKLWTLMLTRGLLRTYACRMKSSTRYNHESVVSRVMVAHDDVSVLAHEGTYDRPWLSYVTPCVSTRPHATTRCFHVCHNAGTVLKKRHRPQKR